MLAQPPASVHGHDSPRRSSRIQVVDVASGAIRPVAPADWLVLASDHAPWQDSLLVEQHRRPPFVGPEHAPQAYLINIRLSPPSLLEWWVAGERPRRQLVTPGDVHLTSAGVPMRNRSQKPAEILALSLAPHVVQHVMHEYVGESRLELRNQRAIRDAQILHLGLMLQGELIAGCPGGRLYGESLATALAIHLLQHYTVRPLQMPSYHGGLPQARLRLVLEHMQAHLDHELSLAALAAVAQMSPYYFSRLFKQSTGLSPHQYILQQRVEWAKRLLADARLSITDVAQRVGFASQAHLTMVFRQRVGTTPRQYRRQR
jgi:AraC family transcriptional regulator